MSTTFYFAFFLVMACAVPALFAMPIWLVLIFATLGIGGVTYSFLGYLLDE